MERRIARKFICSASADMQGFGPRKLKRRQRKLLKYGPRPAAVWLVRARSLRARTCACVCECARAEPRQPSHGATGIEGIGIVWLSRPKKPPGIMRKRVYALLAAPPKTSDGTVHGSLTAITALRETHVAQCLVWNEV